METPAEVAHGPMLIGLLINVMLYGILLVQIYLYTVQFKKDPLWIKLYVALLFVADTISTVFLVVYLYNSLIIHFGDVSFLGTADWVFSTDPAMTALIGSMVQFFFAWRIKILHISPVFVVVIVICAIVGAVSGVATSIAIKYVPEFEEFQKFEVAVIFWLATAAVGDIVITVGLVRYLRTHRTGYAATDDRIDRIIRLTVQTGMLSSIWAIIDLAVYLGDPTGTHLIFNFPLSKLYSNSLMSSLNSRGGWLSEGSRGRTTTSIISTQINVLTTPAIPADIEHGVARSCGRNISFPASVRIAGEYDRSEVLACPGESFNSIEMVPTSDSDKKSVKELVP